MTADKPMHLVPKLRFPEFQDDPPWSDLLLADLYDFKRTNTLSRDKRNYVTETIRNIHYGDIHTKFNPLFQVREEHVPYVNPDSSTKEIDDDAFCKEGDIVLADASEDLDDVGKAIEVVSLDGERVVAGTHTILGTRRGSVPVVGFAGQLFQSAAVRARIKKKAQGAKVYGISAKRISAVPIPIPPTVAEQQKIADCLGSLDDVIAAEGRKLEALRQHKQGLMQQLFPQLGETVPRLRFPEFRDAPEWKQRALEDSCEILNNRRVPITSSDRKSGPYPYYGASGIVDYVDNYRFDERLVLVGEVGAKWGAFQPTAFIAEGKYWVNNHAHVLKPHATNDTLLASYLTMIDLGKFVTGAAPPKLTLGKLKKIPIPLSPIDEEHEAIAGCLSAVDAQTDAQTRKLCALRQHKQGLLQQLFPSLGSPLSYE